MLQDNEMRDFCCFESYGRKIISVDTRPFFAFYLIFKSKNLCANRTFRNCILNLSIVKVKVCKGYFPDILVVKNSNILCIIFGSKSIFT